MVRRLNNKEWHIDIFKATKDDWKQSFFGELVGIRLAKLLTGDFAYQPKFRIIISGRGSIVMLKDFDNESDARDVF